MAWEAPDFVEVKMDAEVPKARGSLDKAGVEAVGGAVLMRYGENPHQQAALYLPVGPAARP